MDPDALQSLWTKDEDEKVLFLFPHITQTYILLEILLFQS